MREMPPFKVQAVAERLQRQKGELVKYLDPLQEKLAELMAQVGDEPLVRLCLLLLTIISEWVSKATRHSVYKNGGWKKKRERKGSRRAWKLAKHNGSTFLLVSTELSECPASRDPASPDLGIPKRERGVSKPTRHWEEGVVKRVRETVHWLFGKVVRASSLVETVNSWLRPFLWRRKGNGRGIYNLLRWCWNTHRFARGKRQGKTPAQLAGSEVNTDDWLELVGFAPKESKV